MREGGTLVCLEDSCPFAIEELELPVTDALKGLPTSVVFGPGSIAHAHKPDEHIPVADYEAAIEHLMAFIAEWCGVA